jgi:antitoxin (DNA-binding transcriptional repressor) of toxin-antitoxin stability system
MKTFTITELKTDAAEIVAQVAGGEPAMIVGGSKVVVMQPLKPEREQERDGYYSGSDAERRQLLAGRPGAESKRDQAAIRTAIRAVRKARRTQ